MEKRTIEQPFKHLLCTVKVIISEYSNYIELVAYSIIGGAAIWAELDDIAISGYRPTPNMFFWVSIIAIISGLVAKMISFSDQKSLSIRFEEYKAAAEKEKQQLKRRYEDTLFDERRQALEECLQDLYENLAFKMQERICIYAYKDEDNHFTCRARYSTHPDHNKFSERKIYPGNDGVIGHVWHKGGHDGSLRDKDFPNPEINFQDYQKYLESTYNIPHHISEGLRMKSVDLYAEVIRDTKKRPVAVIVFESERNNFINEKKIETAYNSNIKVRIVDFLGKMQSHDFIGNQDRNMATLKDITAFFVQEYPFPDELSKARLTKMVYLADWEAAQKNKSQMTQIDWIFHNFGPYVDDVIDMVNQEDIFELEETQNMHGGKKGIVRLKAPYSPSLTKDEKEILIHVIKETKAKYWDSFIKYVYDTYPIKNSDRFDSLDLVSFAKQETP